MTHPDCPNCECGRPKDGETYWYIGSNLRIYAQAWRGSSETWDTERMLSGNFFLSESSCQSACEKVKDLLRGLKKV